MLKKPLCLDHPGPCYHVPSHRTAAVQVPRRIDQRWSGAVGHGWAWYLGEVLKLEFCVSWEAMDLCDMDLFRKVCLEPEMYRSGVAPKSPNHPQLTSAQCFSGLGLVEVASKPQKKVGNTWNRWVSGLSETESFVMICASPNLWVFSTGSTLNFNHYLWMTIIHKN